MLKSIKKYLNKKMNVLVIDDENKIGYTIKRALKNYNVDIFTNIKLLKNDLAVWEKYDLIFLDINMPWINGIDVLKKIKAKNPEKIVIIITAYGNEEIAVNAIKNGADEYLKKPFELSELRNICKKYYDQIFKYSDNNNISIVHKSIKMKKILFLIEKIKNTDATILITGESGVGKELIAKSIHKLSNRKNSPFIPINCSAIPENLIESELFGFEKGSFTGAQNTQIGKFELANNGTIFLDEIGEFPLYIQPKLLRVLQEKTIMRIGGNKEIPVSCRIIAATHQNLENSVKNYKFRKDLYYRLNVIRFEIPPLRERVEDIEPLTRYFFNTFNKKYNLNWNDISKEAIDFLKNYPFPGNIRELQNILERVMLTCDGKIITPYHLESTYGFNKEMLSLKDIKIKDYHTLKKEISTKFDYNYFSYLMNYCNGNITKMSKISKLPRKTIYVKLKEIGIKNGNTNTKKED